MTIIMLPSEVECKKSNGMAHTKEIANYYIANASLKLIIHTLIDVSRVAKGGNLTFSLICPDSNVIAGKIIMDISNCIFAS